MRIIVLIAFLAAAGSIRAQEPLTFKGFKLGAERADFLAAFPTHRSPLCDEKIQFCYLTPKMCYRHAEPEKCKQSLSYGGVMPESMLAQFRENKLVSVSLGFSTNRFDDLSAAMVERFGRPDMDERSVVQNRMGAKFDNRTLAWQRGDAVLSITQRAANIDEGSVQFRSLQHAKQEAAERAKSQKQNAKDL